VAEAKRTNDEPVWGDGRTAVTLVITRGLPGSGKTTWARAWVAEQPARRARVNRDDLRDMLFGGWTGDRAQEDAVTAAQHAAVAGLLRLGRNVVCDDTNLRDEYVDRFRYLAARRGAGFKVVDLTGVPVEVCIERDAARLKPVGEQVIRDMWQRHLAAPPSPLPDAPNVWSNRA
jgi:predicted kinase